MARLGPYELVELLGSGGMGVVWSAWNVRWGHQVAVKVLKEAHRPEAVRALHSEVRAIASLDHPGIVALYDQGVVPAGLAHLAEGSPWLAMEQCVGTLQRPSSWADARAALVGLLEALAAAHAAGVLHLDVKPSNVLRRADGSVALADFGIAMLRSAREASASDTSWGSPPYMAPERFDARAERLLPATDLYAVGCVAFELLHHAAPYSARTWHEAAEAHRSAPVPVLKPRMPVPPGIGEWVSTLLQKRPGDRFQQAADALHALEGLGEPVTGLARDFGSAMVVGPTLTATAAGSPVDVGELITEEPPPPTAPLAPRWAEPRRTPPRHASGGLLGLLGVPFVGRAAVLSALWEGLAAGASLRLTGPWGGGRSRLGAHLMSHAAAAGVGVVAVRPGTAPLVESLVQRMALPADLPADRVREAVALRLGRSLDDPLCVRVRTALAGGDPADGLLAWAAAQRRPTWLWVDDVLNHDVLRLMTAWPDAVLASASDGALAADPPRAQRWSTETPVALAPLTEAEQREVLAGWVGLSSAVVTEVAWRCEGDLALGIRLVVDGVDQGRLVGGADGWQRADEEPWSLPDDLVARWRTRAAALPRSDTLQRAACVWGHVPLAWLGEDGPSLRELLVGAGLASPTEDGFRWPSAALRAAVRRDDEAPVHHRAIAARLGDDFDDCWLRGQHRLLAGDLRPAADDLTAAATHIIARGRMVEAEHWLRRLRVAMAGVVPDDDLRWAQLAYCCAVLGPTHQGYERSMAYAQEAVERSEAHTDDPDWAAVRRSALGMLAWQATVQLLPKVTGPALEAWSRLGPPGDAVMATHHDRMGWHLLTVGDPAGSMAAFTRARDLSGRIGRRTQYVADTSLGVAMRHAGHPDAVQHLTSAGAAMLEAGFASARADLAYALGDAERHRGRPEVALSHYDEALRASAEGDARADIGFLVGRALCLDALGRTDEAVAALRGCVAQLDDDGPTWEAVIHLHLAALGPLPADDVVQRWAAQLVDTGFIDPDVALSLTRLEARLTAAGRGLDALTELAARQRAPYTWLSHG